VEGQEGVGDKVDDGLGGKDLGVSWRRGVRVGGGTRGARGGCWEEGGGSFGVDEGPPAGAVGRAGVEGAGELLPKGKAPVGFVAFAF
jgi:hypothetical protein